MGQSIMEYVLLFAIVSAAILVMQAYMKRGIQGVIKTAADEAGSQKDAEETDLDKGTKSSSNLSTETAGEDRRRIFEGGSEQRDVNRVSTSTGSATYTSEKEK